MLFRSLFTGLLLSAMLLSGPVDEARLQASQLSAGMPITIDGNLVDWGSAGATVYPLRHFDTFRTLVAAPGETDLSATARFTCDGRRLLIAVEVTDDVIADAPPGASVGWRSDAVEVRASGGGANGPEVVVRVPVHRDGAPVQAGVAGGRVRPSSPVPVDAAPLGIEGASAIRPGGYAVEIAIPLEAIAHGSIQPDAVFLQVRVLDRDLNEAMESILQLHPGGFSDDEFSWADGERLLLESAGSPIIPSLSEASLRNLTAIRARRTAGGIPDPMVATGETPAGVPAGKVTRSLCGLEGVPIESTNWFSRPVLDGLDSRSLELLGDCAELRPVVRSEALAALQRSLYFKGDYPESVRIGLKLQGYAPDWEETRRSSFQLLLMTPAFAADPESSVAAFRVALSTRTGHAGPLQQLDLGELLLRAGHPVEAAIHFGSVIGDSKIRAPYRAPAWLGMERALLLQNDIQGAIQVARELKNALPEQTSARSQSLGLLEATLAGGSPAEGLAKIVALMRNELMMESVEAK